MQYFIRIFFVIIVLAGGILACSLPALPFMGAAESEQGIEPTLTIEPTIPPEPTQTSEPTQTPEPTETPVITETPQLVDTTGQIVFNSDREGSQDIYVMKADGSEVIRLTDDPQANDIQPVWSPDGSRIAFTSDREGNQDIYVMAADGSGITRLTDSEEDDYQPAWSPDGSRIAFTSDRDGMTQIYLMDTDGGDVTLLQLEGSNLQPAWSPDGSRIAYVSLQRRYADIYVMDADGTNSMRLTENDYFEVQPCWSPDGTRIVYAARPGSFYQVFVMNADGSEQAALTDGSTDDSRPSWSPDGMQIAFISERDGDREVYLMDLSGEQLVNLTLNPAVESISTGAWQPDPSTGIPLASQTVPTRGAVIQADTSVSPADQDTFEEIFDGDLSNWASFVSAGDPNKEISGLIEGTLRFDVPSIETYAFREYSGRTFEDVYVEAEMATVQSGRNSLAVFCRKSDLGWYELRIMTIGEFAGSYELFRYDPSLRDRFQNPYQRILPLERAYTRDIKTGNNINTLGLSCVGNVMKVFINGVEQTAHRRDVIDDALTEGTVGVGVLSFSSGNVQVDVNQVKGEAR